MIKEDNEFILAAFDVFKSDKDQENLLDTLQRIVNKYKKMGITNSSVIASGFYMNSSNEVDLSRPNRNVFRDARPQTRKGNFSSEDDNMVRRFESSNPFKSVTKEVDNPEFNEFDAD